ncbi:MAG TPA: 1-phosphofructokinase family hexose kinase [Acidimicrobiales bacterium]|nr:1-phosphofructokinase family hexose kinase [Acidimicrobiales bacterium]
MPDIVTLTMNPSLDLSSRVERLLSDVKLRCDEPLEDAGGGGVNVAKAASALGSEVTAVLPLGGDTGERVREQLDLAAVASTAIQLDIPTRQSLAITETSTGRQFRFGFPGRAMAEDRWQRCLEVFVRAARPAAVAVLSGSLPPGVPEDFYGMVATELGGGGPAVIVDTHGPPLPKAVAAGVTLVKPNVRELSEAIGRELNSEIDYVKAARDLLSGTPTRTVVVSMGPAGALVVPAEGPVVRVWAPGVRPVSAVGAGDSMVAGMAVALARGDSVSEAVRLGTATGAAAVMVPESGLSEAGQVSELHDLVRMSEVDL